MVLLDSFILRRGKVIIHLPVISNFNGVSLESASFSQHPLHLKNLWLFKFAKTSTSRKGQVA